MQHSPSNNPSTLSTLTLGKVGAGMALLAVGEHFFEPKFEEYSMRVTPAATEGLKLRAEPITGAELGKIPAGTEVTVIGEDSSGQWAQVKFVAADGKEMTGWAAKQLGPVTYLQK